MSPGQKRLKRRQSELSQRQRFQGRELQMFLNLLTEWKLDGIQQHMDVAGTFRRCRAPAPTVQAATTKTPGADRVFEDLRSFFKDERWQPPGLSRAYSVKEFYPIVWTARKVLALMPAHLRRVGQTSLAIQAQRTLAELNERRTCEEYENWIGSSIREILTDHGRMVGELYSLTRSTIPTPSETTSNHFELQATRPDRVVLSIEGQSREVIRCGQTTLGFGLDGNPGIDWVTWDATQLGLRGNHLEELPVYVQTHLFERLYGRDGRISSLAEQESLLHDSVYWSLKEPALHPAPGRIDTYLVEYRVEDLKLGYLVCQVLPEAVVVRTFLFLTMNGTPEGQRLYHQARLRRSDKEYLGLDRLGVLFTTDIASDPALRSMLDDCGLRELYQHLLVEGPLQPGYAEELRRYLEL